MFLYSTGTLSDRLSVALAELGNQACSFLLISKRVLLDLDVAEPSQGDELKEHTYK